MSRFITMLEDVEITRAEDVAKHGDHDQSSHGSWAQGVQVAPEIVRSTLERVKENGGLSVSLKDGSEPTQGFMVAKGKKFAAIVKADDFFDEAKGAEILSSYMKQHKSEFNNSNNYLGLWHNTDDGQVYLDVSENIKDEGEAISRGRERDQISIWDVANFKEIETGGTGGIEKTRSSTTARYVEHDGRADRRLRQRDLGEVSKRQERFKVIYFDYGLKPVLKHEGHEDQSSHGNWARGISAEDEELINQMSTMGPAKEDILNAIKGGEQADMSDLEMMVNNDSGLYSQATDGIEERVEEAFQENKYEYQDQEETDRANEALRNRLYEQMQDQMVQEFIESDDGSLAAMWQEENGGSSNPEDLIGYFDEVYSIRHEVTDNAGEVVSVLNSTTTNIYNDGSNLVIQGQVTDSEGNFAGEFQRSFYTETGSDGEDVLVVEHDLFRMADEYQGSGFGSKFLAQQEAYYVSKGLDAINVGTAWDGARHWARAGFDFNPKYIDQNIGTIAKQIEINPESYGADTPIGKEFDALMSKATVGYTRDSEGRPTWARVQSMKEDDFPTPNDFAMLGYGARVQSGTNEFGKPTYSWAGKDILSDLNLKYRKGLTQEGRTINQGPIDRDGDGVVFDGTAREKPLSEVKLTP
jgi:hypothetical protein